MKITLAALLCILACAACHKTDNPGKNSGGDIIYFESNDFSQNAVFAYLQKDDSTLVQIPGSPFAAGGKGVPNPTQALGPDDGDKQVIITNDKKFLLAVNEGSSSVAVFSINSQGMLSPVPGSPFASNGDNPVSIDQQGNYIYIVNKGINGSAANDGVKPNYTSFTIDNNGKLNPVPGSTVETGYGSSPSNALVSRNGKFLFGTDFLAFMQMPAAGTLRSFTLTNGLLSGVQNTPYTIPEKGGALGLWQHPLQDVLYVGFPLAGKVGVYNIDNTNGSLTYKTSVDAGPAACWLRTNKSGNNLYALNSGENTVSVFNTSNATAPVALQKLALKNSGPIYMAMGMPFTTSQDFSFEFSGSGQYLYVISQYTNTDFTLGNFNLLHVLKTAADGSLSEPAEPMPIPVPNQVRPQGVVVWTP